MKLEEVANNIVLNESGIYFSKSESDISYPEEGNESCMQLEENSKNCKVESNLSKMLSKAWQVLEVSNMYIDYKTNNQYWKLTMLKVNEDLI